MNKTTITLLVIIALGLSACTDSETTSRTETNTEQSSSDSSQAETENTSDNETDSSSSTNPDNEENPSSSDSETPPSEESPEPESAIEKPSFKLNLMHESRSLQGDMSADNWAYDIKKGTGSNNLVFKLSNSNPSLFEVQPSISFPSGTLRYKTKPSSGGQAKLKVALYNKDTDTNSEALETTIKINAAFTNKAPSFNAKGDTSSLNDVGFVQIKDWATNINDNNASNQKMHFEVTSNSNSSLFQVSPMVSYPSGTLRYKAKPDAEGTAKITVVLVDDGTGTYGGEDSSAPYSFNITIKKPTPEPKPVNHAPSFDNKGDQTSKDDAGAVEIAGWAYNISDGDGNAQNLSFEIVSNSNPSLFVVQPSVSYPSGTLRYTPKESAEGSATLSVRLKDDGGTSNGGMDVSGITSTIITISHKAEVSNGEIPVGIVTLTHSDLSTGLVGNEFNLDPTTIVRFIYNGSDNDKVDVKYLVKHVPIGLNKDMFIGNGLVKLSFTEEYEGSQTVEIITDQPIGEIITYSSKRNITYYTPYIVEGNKYVFPASGKSTVFGLLKEQ